MSDASESSDTNERYGRVRKLLHGLFGVSFAAAALGAFTALGSDPLGALVAGVMFALAAGLTLRRTRTWIIDHVDRDIGTVSLGITLVVLISVAGAAAPATPAPSGSSGSGSASVMRRRLQRPRQARRQRQRQPPRQPRRRRPRQPVLPRQRRRRLLPRPKH